MLSQSISFFELNTNVSHCTGQTGQTLFKGQISLRFANEDDEITRREKMKVLQQTPTVRSDQRLMTMIDLMNSRRGMTLNTDTIRCTELNEAFRRWYPRVLRVEQLTWANV